MDFVTGLGWGLLVMVLGAAGLATFALHIKCKHGQMIMTAPLTCNHVQTFNHVY